MAKGDERPKKKDRKGKFFSRTYQFLEEEEAQRTVAVLKAREAIGMADRPLEEILAKLEADPVALEIYNSVLRSHGLRLE